MSAKISEPPRSWLAFCVDSVTSLNITRLNDIAKIYYFINLGLEDMFNLINYPKAASFLSAWQFTQTIRVINGVTILYKVGKIGKKWLNRQNFPQSPAPRSSSTTTNTASTAPQATTVTNNPVQNPATANGQEGSRQMPWKSILQVCDILSELFLIIKAPIFFSDYNNCISDFLFSLPDFVNMISILSTGAEVHKNEEKETIDSLINSLNRTKAAIEYCGKLQSIQKHLLDRVRLLLIRTEAVNAHQAKNYAFKDLEELIEKDSERNATLEELKSESYQEILNLNEIRYINYLKKIDTNKNKKAKKFITTIKSEALITAIQMEKDEIVIENNDKDKIDKKLEFLKRIKFIYFKVLLKSTPNLKTPLAQKICAYLKRFINHNILNVAEAKDRLNICMDDLRNDHEFLVNSISEVFREETSGLKMALKPEDAETFKQLSLIKDFLIIRESISFCHSLMLHSFCLKCIANQFKNQSHVDSLFANKEFDEEVREKLKTIADQQIGSIHKGALDQFKVYIDNEMRYLKKIGSDLVEKMKLHNFETDVIKLLEKGLKVCESFESITKDKSYNLFKVVEAKPTTHHSSRFSAQLGKIEEMEPVYNKNNSETQLKGIIDYENNFSEKVFNLKIVKYEFVKKIDTLLSTLEAKKTKE